MTQATIDALNFYRYEAEALARYMIEGKENKSDAILAAVTVLSLDGGRRARDVLEENCPGHVASADDPRVCAHCGVHIDSLRPPEDGDV